jgi:hypothetical protein
MIQSQGWIFFRGMIVSERLLLQDRCGNSALLDQSGAHMQRLGNHREANAHRGAGGQLTGIDNPEVVHLMAAAPRVHLRSGWFRAHWAGAAGCAHLREGHLATGVDGALRLTLATPSSIERSHAERPRREL